MALDIGELPPGRFFQIPDLPGPVVETASGVGQLERGLGVIEQFNLQGFFQFADIKAQGRLGDKETGRCLCQCTFFHDDDEVIQMAEYHKIPPLLHAARVPERQKT